SGGGITQRTLAEKMEIGQPAMVALLDRLEKDEFIARNPMPGDRRASSLELTASGKKLISKIEIVAHGLREEILDGFSDSELQTASKVLARMKVKLEAFP
ncbi:MAG: MarR family transcriptional regulator, partial [Betaproteobacteria bacterium]